MEDDGAEASSFACFECEQCFDTPSTILEHLSAAHQLFSPAPADAEELIATLRRFRCLKEDSSVDYVTVWREEAMSRAAMAQVCGTACDRAAQYHVQVEQRASGENMQRRCLFCQEELLGATHPSHVGAACDPPAWVQG